MLLTVFGGLLLWATALPVALAQEAYLVNGFHSGVAGFNLSTFNPIETIHGPANNFSLAVGPNPRLAFVSSVPDLSVVDLTIQREIRRLPQIPVFRFSAFTSGDKDLPWRIIKKGH